MLRTNTLRISFVLILSWLFHFQGYGQCPFNTPEFPFTTDDPFSLYSWSSNLYMPGQIGGGQTFTNVSFRLDNDFSWGNYTYNDIRVYMRHTSVSNFASDPGYPGTGGFTQVYSGGMTFNGPGIYTFSFNVAPNFVYNGTDQLEVLFENRGGSDNTSEEPWFDRTDDAGSGVFPGKVGWGFSFANATTISSNRRFNLQINGVMCSGFPLPVSLTKFDAKCDDEKVSLTWQTASETNNDFFTIERSNEDGSFEVIGRVNGHGTTTTTSHYSFTDESPLNGNGFYRLSQTDIDGTTTQYNILTTRCGEEFNVQVSPNPFNDRLRVNSSRNGTIQLIDISGKVVLDQHLSAGENEIVTESLESAVYVAQITLESGETEQLKVVKQ